MYWVIVDIWYGIGFYSDHPSYWFVFED
jgi:hypothetical protein